MSISRIERMWAEGKLPIHDGLYRADGSSWTIGIDVSARPSIDLLGPFDLESFLDADPDYMAAIDITIEKEIPGGSGFMCAGEGSHGSEGFFARLDRRRRLIWVVYLEFSNPFIEMVIDERVALVPSSSGLCISVDLTYPEFSN
ncbi:hypothetical protein [Spongiactinospora sp. 9N601]|uniref:hypothetical protein n=1 Tax=Spongiactinospora sp. 9N601 TaxID=3375149 RepID=UPI0037A21C7E